MSAITAGTVLCPHCKGEYLSHHNVSVYNRDFEDSEKGLSISITGNTMETTDMRENPSPRRNGLTIDFMCENCGTPSTLNVYQHKGQTLTEWV